MSAIVEIKVHVLEIPLKVSWQTSLYSTQTRAHCFVRIRTGDGITGYGEASPAAAFMGETAYTMETIIQRYFCPVLMGESIFNVSKINDLMDQVFAGNTSAKAAIDIAVHDALGKTLKVPVYDLLGGRKREAIQLVWSMGFKEFGASIEEGRTAMEQGYSVMKVKVGKGIQEDVRLVKALREVFGSDVPLRMDANQGFTPQDAVLFLRRVQEFDPESFEQPVKKWNHEGLRFVRDHSLGVRIMADESVSSLSDAFLVIAGRCADFYNIKVGKVGGLYRARQIAGIVEAAGFEAAAGSNLELGIGEAASFHFITSQSAVSLPSDVLCGSGLHQYNVISNPVIMSANGAYCCSDAPGLGVDVDPDLFKD